MVGARGGCKTMGKLLERGRDKFRHLQLSKGEIDQGSKGPKVQRSKGSKDDVEVAPDSLVLSTRK